MMTAVNDKLIKSYANCVGLQILNVEFAVSRETAIINSQLAKQTKNQKQYQKDAVQIRAKIGVDNSEAKKKVTILQGEAKAESTKILNKAKAYIKSKIINYSID